MPNKFTLNQILQATGGSAARLNTDISVSRICTDSRKLKCGDLFIAIRGEYFDGHDFIKQALEKGAKIIIVENSYGLKTIHETIKANKLNKIALVKVVNTKKALADIAKFYRRRFDLPLIGVTGSCGKTITKDMIFSVLSERFKVLKNEGTFNNLIGLSQAILRLNSKVDLTILEMGTSNFGEVRALCEIATPSVGVITNIGPSHLEFFGSLRGVSNEKYALADNLKSPNLAIVNGDDPFLKKKIKAGKNKSVFTFGIRNKCDLQAQNVKINFSKIDFKLNNKHQFRLNVLGRHNVYNALAAIACGLSFGISMTKIKKRLLNFKMPATRINFKKFKNFQVIDDTYNSNPLSLSCAIDTLKDFNVRGKKILVMGDMLELGKNGILMHRQIANKIIKSRIDTLITVGDLSYYTARSVKKINSKLEVYSCDSSQQAKNLLLNVLKKGDLVLVKGSRRMQMEKAVEGL